MLYNMASKQLAAPGAVARCEGLTGICGLKYALKKLANASRTSASPPKELGYDRCFGKGSC